MLSHILSPNPVRRAAPAPAFINLTFYGSPAVLALIRKRLYEELRQRSETVADVRYSTDEMCIRDRATTMPARMSARGRASQSRRSVERKDMIWPT